MEDHLRHSDRFSDEESSGSESSNAESSAAQNNEAKDQENWLRRNEYHSSRRFSDSESSGSDGSASYSLGTEYTPQKLLVHSGDFSDDESTGQETEHEEQDTEQKEEEENSCSDEYNGVKKIAGNDNDDETLSRDSVSLRLVGSRNDSKEICNNVREQCESEIEGSEGIGSLATAVLSLVDCATDGEGAGDISRSTIPGLKDSLERLISALVGKYQHRNNELLKGIEERHNVLMQENERLEMEMETVDEEKGSRITCMEQDLIDAVAKYAEMEQTLSSCRHKVDVLDDEIAVKNSKIHELNVKMESLLEETHLATQTCEELSELYSDSQGRLAALTKEHETAMELIEEFRSRTIAESAVPPGLYDVQVKTIADLEKRCSSLEIELSENDLQVQLRDEYVDSCLDQNKDLKAEVQILKNENLSMKHEMCEKDVSLEKSEERFADAKRKLSEFQAGEQTYLEKIEVLEAEGTSMKTQLASMEEVTSSIRARLQVTEQKVDDLNTEVEQVNSDLVQALSLSSKLKVTIVELQDEKKTLHEEANFLRLECSTLVDDLKNKAELFEEEQRQLKKFDGQKLSTESSTTDLDELKLTLTSAGSENTRIRVSLKEKESEISQIAAKFQECETEKANLYEECIVLREELEITRGVQTKELKELQSLHASEVAKNKLFSSQILTFEKVVSDLQDNIASVREAGEEKTSALEQARIKHIELENRCASLQSIAGEDKQIIDELRSKVLGLESEVNASENALNLLQEKNLADLDQSREESETRFNELLYKYRL